MLWLSKIHVWTHSYIPSDGSGLTEQVWKFAVSGVWQQHATCSSYDAEKAKDEEWQNLEVNALKQIRCFKMRHDEIKHLYTC